MVLALHDHATREHASEPRLVPPTVPTTRFNAQLPLAASLERTAAVNNKIDAIMKETPGVKYYSGIAGYSLLSSVNTTYNSFYFVTLEDWDVRDEDSARTSLISS